MTLAPPDWLTQSELQGTSVDEGLARFDELPPVRVEEMFGRWRGSGLPSGHAWDGVLEKTGWYGKEFVDAETVHPLLFRAPGGSIVPLNPRWAPVEWLAGLSKLPPVPPFAPALLTLLLQTRRPAARVRMTEYRGVSSATMIYDHLPIQDVFRRIDADTLLGVMDLRGLARPFLFVLRRDR